MVLIDVRTPAEARLGKIEGAIEIDLKASTFMDKIQSLDRSVPYALYCRSGRRSKLAMNQMKTLGFKEVYDLEGGYNAWVKSMK
jgi:rhodanese-related sulfurtransferase